MKGTGNKISLNTARRLALHCQILDGSVDLPLGKEGVYQCIDFPPAQHQGSNPPLFMCTYIFHFILPSMCIGIFLLS